MAKKYNPFEPLSDDEILYLANMEQIQRNRNIQQLDNIMQLQMLQEMQRQQEELNRNLNGF